MNNKLDNKERFLVALALALFTTDSYAHFAEKGIAFLGLATLIFGGIFIFHSRWKASPLRKGVSYFLYLVFFILDIVAYANFNWLNFDPDYLGASLSDSDLMHFTVMQLGACGLAIYLSGKLVPNVK